MIRIATTLFIILIIFTGFFIYQREFVPWTLFIAELSKFTPPAISIFNVNINSDNVTISGFATTRDALLEFQQALKDSNLFVESDVPLENLLTKENINFNIKAVLNLTKLQANER